MRREIYEGEEDEKRLVRIEFSGGASEFYEGPKGEERLVKSEARNGLEGFIDHG